MSLFKYLLFTVLPINLVFASDANKLLPEVYVKDQIKRILSSNTRVMGTDGRSLDVNIIIRSPSKVFTNTVKLNYPTHETRYYTLVDAPQVHLHQDFFISTMTQFELNCLDRQLEQLQLALKSTAGQNYLSLNTNQSIEVVVIINDFDNLNSTKLVGHNIDGKTVLANEQTFMRENPEHLKALNRAIQNAYEHSQLHFSVAGYDRILFRKEDVLKGNVSIVPFFNPSARFWPSGLDINMILYSLPGNSKNDPECRRTVIDSKDLELSFTNWLNSWEERYGH